MRKVTAIAALAAFGHLGLRRGDQGAVLTRHRDPRLGHAEGVVSVLEEFFGQADGGQDRVPGPGFVDPLQGRGEFFLQVLQARNLGDLSAGPHADEIFHPQRPWRFERPGVPHEADCVELVLGKDATECVGLHGHNLGRGRRRLVPHQFPQPGLDGGAREAASAPGSGSGSQPSATAGAQTPMARATSAANVLRKTKARALRRGGTRRRAAGTGIIGASGAGPSPAQTPPLRVQGEVPAPMVPATTSGTVMPPVVLTVIFAVKIASDPLSRRSVHVG